MEDQERIEEGGADETLDETRKGRRSNETKIEKFIKQ